LNAAVTASRSARACSIDVPRRTRPTSRMKLPGPAVASDSASGTHASVRPGYVKPGGMTPVTVRASPSTVIAEPTMRGSAPNRRIHNAWLSTMTGGPPG
jgi:hypothetical protein